MSKPLPTSKEAVLTIIDEAWREKRRKRSFAKCSVALMVLGLNNLEVIEVLHYLELCGKDGEPW